MGLCYHLKLEQTNQTWLDAKEYCERTPGRYLPSFTSDITAETDLTEAFAELQFAFGTALVF